MKRNLLAHTYDENNVLQAQQLIVQHFAPVIAQVTQYLEEKSAQ